MRIALHFLALASACSVCAADSNGKQPADEFTARGAELQAAGQLDAALQFYRQSAISGSSDGAFHAGALGLEIAMETKGKSRVLQADESIRHLYRAATNGHAGACLVLSQTFREGETVAADATQSYAWLVIAKRFDPAIPLQTLDSAAVELDMTTLRHAQETARKWLTDGWPANLTPEIVQGDPRFKINGISRGATTSVLINRKTFLEGDSASVAPLSQERSKTPAASVDITCAAIGSDYVLLRVAGTPELRLLALDVN